MASRFDVSLEITPPRSDRPELLWRRARLLESHTRRVNVIARRDRQSSLDASLRLLGLGFEPVWHIANRGRSVAEVEADIERAATGGLDRMLCVRGEYKATDCADTPKIREVVRTLRRALPGASIGVSVDHHRGAGVFRNLGPKLEAGADRVQTQVTFDLEALAPVADEILARAPRVQIVPMVLPLLSREAAVRTARRLSIPLPQRLLSRLEELGEAAGWEHFEALVASVAHDERFAGVAIMTPMDANSEYARRLRAVLSRQL
jgi:5,10-methylenetetrahydrofolate reductase